MTRNLRVAIRAAGMALAAVCGGARADEVPLVTGEHGVKSSEEVKKACLVGLTNLIQVETACHAANPPPDAQNFVPRLAQGLQGQTWRACAEG